MSVMELFILIVVLAILAETTTLIIKSKSPRRIQSNKKIYVDTSALIDGRILNVARTGFIMQDLVILKSVLLELQLLADSKDSEKRTRARAGLSVVRELERIIHFNVEIFDDEALHAKVDEQLLKYAKENRGTILTLDYNLIKVAEAEKIPTLNINDLAIAIRNEFLPGEKVNVTILTKGANKGQGIGYLPDGTMVVVDNAEQKVGESLTVELIKLHETSAGKMIFGKIAVAKTTQSSSGRRQASSPKKSSRRQSSPAQSSQAPVQAPARRSQSLSRSQRRNQPYQKP